MGIQEGLQLGLGHGALVAGDFNTVSEQDQGGQALDLASVAELTGLESDSSLPTVSLPV
jgi:hypothetical protein